EREGPAAEVVPAHDDLVVVDADLGLVVELAVLLQDVEEEAARRVGCLRDGDEHLTAEQQRVETEPGEEPASAGGVVQEPRIAEGPARRDGQLLVEVDDRGPGS